MRLAQRVAARYLRASRLMKPPLDRVEMENLVDEIVMAARENARETAGRPDKSKGPYDLDWEAKVDKALAPSIEGALVDVNDPRHCRNYGLEKPLNARQYTELVKKCRGRNRY